MNSKKSLKKVAIFIMSVVMILLNVVSCTNSTENDISKATDKETVEEVNNEKSEELKVDDSEEGKKWDYSSFSYFDQDKTIIGEENIFFEELVNDLWGNEVRVPDKKLTIGFVPKAMENEFWRMVDDGIQEEVKRMNDAGFDVTVDTRTGQGETDTEGQLSVMLDMINKQYDAIIIGPISDANLIPGVERAKEANIPVIPIWVFFRGEDSSYLETYMGPSCYLEGQYCAEYFAEQIGEEGGQVAVITGIPSNVITGARTDGFTEYFEKHPEENIEVVDIQNGDWDRMIAKDIADTMIKAYPDLKGIYCNNDTMALGVVEALRAADKMDEILVGGTDAVGEALESISAGDLDYTSNNYPFYMGKISLLMTIRTLAGENLPLNIIPNVVGITNENVDIPASETYGWQDIKWVSEYSK